MNEETSYETLKQAALDGLGKAYAPYSGFAVGAAVVGESGRIYSGCNVENASYGLTNCAERTAIFKAVSDGETRLKRLFVIADTDGPVAPCGACRQVMWEFGISEVILSNLRGERKVVLLSELLPYAFGPEQLKGASQNE